MVDQLPIITGTRAVNTTATTPSTSLIGRGLSAIQRKETGIARTELDARYRQARDIYNRITNYSYERRFNCEDMPKRGKQFDVFDDNPLQHYFAMLQQLANGFAVFQQLADQGYGRAYFPLARMYEGGQGISQDLGKADYYCRLAYDWYLANQTLNEPEIWRDLAWRFRHGSHWDIHLFQALCLYLIAAEQGDAAAQFELSVMYENGHGEKDHKKSAFWLGKAAENGHMIALWTIGNYQKAAELGDAESQLRLAQNYNYGWGGKDYDHEQALYWYHKAAEQGHIKAQQSLGHLLYLVFQFPNDYTRVHKDINQAVFWTRIAAEHGDAVAQDTLGDMYEKGFGVDQDYKQAAFWYRKAAQQRYAKKYLGSMGDQSRNTSGFGSPQNYEEAIYRNSRYDIYAEQGKADAQFKLGLIYQNIRVLSPDYKKSAFWLTKAAEQDHAEAQYNLGWLYENGYGVEQDDAQASFWYHKAAKQGDARAQESLTKLGINWKDA
jgi:TPR repeat protein